MKKKNSAYVYRHRRLDTNEIFYVGIGYTPNYKRAYDRIRRSLFWKRIIAKHDYQVEIIQDKISWEDAQELEIFLISLYGRKKLGTGNLVNIREGGEGLTAEENYNFGNKGLLNPLFGKKRSLEECVRMRKAIKEKGSHLGKQRGNNSRAKLVLDTEMGIFYDCLKDASDALRVNYSALRAMMQGRNKNRTSLIYC